MSRNEAAKLINIGVLSTSNDPVALVLTQALDSGMSIDSVDALRRGLGDADAPLECAELIAGAARRTPEQLFRDARHTRNLHDEELIVVHEKQRSDLRSVKAWWDAEGMYCGSWRLPAEEGSILATAFDAFLSPRRGGPRFVSNPVEVAAPSPLDDVRTSEQILADGLVDLVRIGVDADPGTMFGRRRPAVRVMVTDATLSPGPGMVSSRAVALAAARRRSLSPLSNATSATQVRSPSGLTTTGSA